MSIREKHLINNLAGKIYKKNSARNRILIVAVAVGIMAIFSILSLISGRIDAIYTTNIRSVGDASSIFLEGPSKLLYSQVKELDYIDDVGGEWSLGTIMENEITVGFCAYSDKTKFEKINSPAYTDIIGSYPQEKNEIMLSRRSLTILGISSPKIGQTIAVNIIDDDKSHNEKPHKKEFVLSGYYTNYINDIDSYVYFSKTYALSAGKNISLPEYIYINHKDTIPLEKVEKMLYEDLSTKNDTQQFLVSDTAAYSAVAQAVGGYKQGVICGALILLCISLLIYNVMNISLRNEIQFYGQLKTIGSDENDIMKIILLQILRVIIWGIIIGTTFGVLISLCLIPKLLSNVYLHNFGPATDMMGFNIEYLLLAVAFVVLVTLISTMIPVWKMKRMSPVDAIRYTGKVNKKTKKGYTSKKTNTPYKNIALKNLKFDKGKMTITVISIVVGILFAQCSMIIINGLDQTNIYKFLPDFIIKSGNSPLTNIEYSTSTNPIDDSILKNIMSINGIEDVIIDYASYVKFDVHDDSWYPILKVANTNLGYGSGKSQVKKYINDRDGDFDGSIAILTDEEIHKLNTYSKKNDMNWDIAGLKNGSVALNATSHIFTNEMKDEASNVSGEAITIYNFEGEKCGSITFGGYVDIENRGFPIDNKKAWGQKERPALFVSEAGFDKLNIEKKIHRMEINVDKEHIEAITNRINSLVEDRNITLQGENPELLIEYNVILDDKVSLIKEAERSVFMMEVVMYTIAAILVCMGIINFVNATVTNIISMRKEYALMEVVGMEKNQLQRVVTYESLFLVVSVLVSVFSLGSIVLYVVNHYISNEYPYYSFAYPIIPTLVIVISIIFFSLLIPYITLNKTMKNSAVEQLRKVI